MIDLPKLRSGVPALVTLIALGALPACLEPGEGPETETHQSPITAYCTALVNGVGTVDVETDYLPHVVQCENGGAPLEALKAQAVAARSYLYYKLDSSGSINDGTSDQVYSCGRTPNAQHIQAVAETAGEVLRYSGVTICAFYVAGAIPSASSCVATGSDSDPTNTEHYVTYNWGLSGNNIEQTTLGWVNTGNLYNRGCKSQNGASCLADEGWTYDDILKFYYGMDIVLHQAEGSCVSSQECTPGDTETQDCPLCGTETRTCDSGGNWGSWGACTGQGVCEDGATETESCGDCGEWTRTCDSNCTWGAFGACEGDDPDPVQACQTGLPGICSAGQQRCVSGNLTCVQNLQPTTEVCDYLDNDCNGSTDEGGVCEGVDAGTPPPDASLPPDGSVQPDPDGGQQQGYMTVRGGCNNCQGAAGSRPGLGQLWWPAWMLLFLLLWRRRRSR